ncbi:MAG: hypothetical protein ACRDRH_25330 [Pseudonocardia sp.]
MSSTYTVVHHYRDDDAREAADVLDRYDGMWTLQATTPRSTHVDRKMIAVPKMPAPGFIVRQAIRQDLRATLCALRRYLVVVG